MVFVGLSHFTAPLRIPLTSLRSQVKQYLLQSVTLCVTISQKTYLTNYGRFRPNNSDHHLQRRYYRGGWHPSYPLLIRQGLYPWQKPMQSISTGSTPITLSCIVKVSRLLHPVGLGLVSQNPSPGSLSQGPYRSKAW